jgi:hypothetical protein
MSKDELNRDFNAAADITDPIIDSRASSTSSTPMSRWQPTGWMAAQVSVLKDLRYAPARSMGDDTSAISSQIARDLVQCKEKEGADIVEARRRELQQTMFEWWRQRRELEKLLALRP